MRISQSSKKPGNSKSDINKSNSDKKKSTAKKLLKFANTWQGDDFEDCLKEVYKTHGETSF